MKYQEWKYEKMGFIELFFFNLKKMGQTNWLDGHADLKVIVSIAI